MKAQERRCLPSSSISWIVKDTSYCIIKNILKTLPTGEYWYYTDKCDHLFKESISIDTDGPHEDAHMLTHPISVIYLNV